MGGTKDNKLVVLGSGGVGKTSLVVQYIEGCFDATYKPTVEDYYRHTVVMPNGTFHAVEILDTAGSLHFPAMRELSIRWGRGFILVFSVNNVQTFHEAMELWNLIQTLRGEKVPVILVGNKTDLTGERQVSEEMVQEALQDPSRICKYIETSAKCNQNVTKLFQELLQHAENLEAPPPDPHRQRRLSRRLSSLGSITLNTLNVRRRSSVPKESTTSLSVNGPTTKKKSCSKSCIIV